MLLCNEEIAPRSKCLIDGKEMYFDFWNSKERTEQSDFFEYLGQGRVTSSRGVSISENDISWQGHFWRNKNIPKDQDFQICYI